MSPELVDMHLHLDSFEDPSATADELAALGVATFAVTVTPRRYELFAELAEKENVRLGVGMHPWYFEEPELEINVEKAVEFAAETRFVGELGLDFFERHAPESTWAKQRYALERILGVCAEASSSDAPHLISLHAVRSAGEALDLLEKTGCTERCTCIMHWFSGSTEELWRAIGLGCFFSVNRMGAATKRAKEQLKLIPADRLLLETDYPPNDHRATPAEWAREVHDSLTEASKLIAGIRGASAQEIRTLTTENANSLLDLPAAE